MDIVESKNGMKLGVVELDPADQLDLFEACGRMSTNPGWVGLALLACSVRSINGVPEPMPATQDQVRNLARRLGHEGIAAVRKSLEGDTDVTPVGGEKVDADVAKN